MKRILAATFVCLAACGSPQPPPTPSPAAPAAGDGYRVTGPYVHENLAVYLVHSKDADAREYLTLAEALGSGVVKVTEKQNEEVEQLRLENTGDLPVFIQEGDRVIGGKQDRIIGLSFVVPPKSGSRTIPAFCVEQGRWKAGLTGATFTGPDNGALAAKEIRDAAKFKKDQSVVWEQVSRLKQASLDELNTGFNTTSLNETLEDPRIKKLCDEAAAALGGIAAKHADAVGIAIAMNGRLEEVNVYPSPSLLRKMAPRLVQSYALSAAVKKEEEGTAPAADEVLRFMKETEGKAARTEQIDAANRAHTVTAERMYGCTVEYEGRTVHGQWVRK